MNSHDKKWFDCDDNTCLHSFETALNRITAGSWCPYCANKKICDDIGCKICFDKSFISHQKAEFWSPLNEDNPRDLFLQSSEKRWFDCDDNACLHSFESTLHNINAGNWCPYCANKKICDDIGCEICFDKSFLSHPNRIFGVH